MKVLFLGSSQFSAIVLKVMLQEGINIVGLITQPDRPCGRGHRLTPNNAKILAEANGIPCFCYDKMKEHKEEIEAIDYDISVVASFGQILPKWFLEHKLCINVHPSLLPKYRGASPIQNAILNGDGVTGVTIMKVAMEVDSGDIILQEEYKMQGEYYSQLELALGKLGGKMAATAVMQAKDGSITFTPQEHDKAVHVQKFSKEDGLLDFNNSAAALENRVRALSELVGCYFMIDGQPIKVVKAKAIDEQLEKGVVGNNKKRFIIGTSSGALEILECKAPSGKTVRGQDYLNGHNEILGAKVNV
ncbi:MAG: methionyl-tRNA formyltransferase [Clostridia bacterium]|nr:methionyl-tRNA formyltransferase [Clostridia bacterium]